MIVLNETDTYILVDKEGWLKHSHSNLSILKKIPEILTGFKIELYVTYEFHNTKISGMIGECIVIGINEHKFFSILEDVIYNKLDKFDLCFIEIAKSISTLSKDPSTKLGAVITGKNKQIISQGYNGFPRGVKDLPERYNNKESKYSMVVHAETNAIYNALTNGANIEGSTIYIYGLSCCNECAKAIIQCGIKKVVQKITKVSSTEKWIESHKISEIMFNESGVEVVTI